MSVMEGCLFCKIAAGEIPAVKVYEDNEIIAFLDIAPVREGHTLIVPKSHHDYFEDLPPALAAKIMNKAQEIAKAHKKLYGVKRVGLMFTGVDVAHAHCHVIPMVKASDITSRQYIKNEDLEFEQMPRADIEMLKQSAENIQKLLK